MLLRHAGLYCVEVVACAAKQRLFLKWNPNSPASGMAETARSPRQRPKYWEWNERELWRGQDQSRFIQLHDRCSRHDYASKKNQ